MEVLPGANNYRTHQVVEIDLTQTKARWAGTIPVPSSDAPGLAAGESANQTSLAANGDAGAQSPLSTNSSIPQRADTVKNGQAVEGTEGAVTRREWNEILAELRKKTET